MAKNKRPDAGPLGSFEEQVMVAVIRTGGEAYGMAVRRELEAVTGRDVTIGSVYITLDRLEAKGYLESGRPPANAESGSRRVFAVTPAGGRALAETRALRDRLWAGVKIPAPARS